MCGRRFALGIFAVVLAVAGFAADTYVAQRVVAYPDAQPRQPTVTPTNWWAEAAIEGVVVDGDDADSPVEGATVFVHYPGLLCDWSTTTAADGRFVRRCYDIFSFPIHYVSVHVVAEGYEHWSDRVALGIDEVHAELAPVPTSATPAPIDNLRFVVTTGTVTRVDSGTPIRGALIEAQASPGRCLSPVWSDDTGFFELVCIEANYLGSVTFRASAAGHLGWERTVTGPNIGVALDITLEPTERIFLPVAASRSYRSD